MCTYYHVKCVEYKHNTSKLWQTINEIVGKSSNKTYITDHVKVNGIDDYTVNGIGNAFGNFFSNVGKNYAEKIPKSKRSIKSYLETIWRNQESIFLIPTTTFEIANIVKGLPNKKSSGHDNVNNVLLKEVVHQISPMVENLFYDSLKLGIFPERMKVAEIAPLHKSKDTDIVDN